MSLRIIAPRTASRSCSSSSTPSRCSFCCLRRLSRIFLLSSMRLLSVDNVLHEADLLKACFILMLLISWWLLKLKNTSATARVLLLFVFVCTGNSAEDHTKSQCKNFVTSAQRVKILALAPNCIRMTNFHFKSFPQPKIRFHISIYCVWMLIKPCALLLQLIILPVSLIHCSWAFYTIILRNPSHLQLLCRSRALLQNWWCVGQLFVFFNVISRVWASLSDCIKFFQTIRGPTAGTRCTWFLIGIGGHKIQTIRLLILPQIKNKFSNLDLILLAMKKILFVSIPNYFLDCR